LMVSTRKIADPVSGVSTGCGSGGGTGRRGTGETRGDSAKEPSFPSADTKTHRKG
jgi:uncharacterized spore protein YtfJ